jgi:hypothetical protein
VTKAVTRLYRNLSRVGSVIDSCEVLMRINKILSFSVVIVLIAVPLAGALTVPAAAQYDTMPVASKTKRTISHG